MVKQIKKMYFQPQYGGFILLTQEDDKFIVQSWASENKPWGQREVFDNEVAANNRFDGYTLFCM